MSQRRVQMIVGAVLSLVLILSLASSHITASLASPWRGADGSLAVYNETFGFGAVVMISLPDRTDRRDAMSLLTSLYNVSITHTVDAVRGEAIAEKALPFGNARKTQDAGHMGSWRSHMDAFRYIVDNRIETTLLFEDDVDWDVQVREELHAFALGLRSSTLRPPFTPTELARAPYGLDWDILHIANAMIKSPPPPYHTLAALYPDPHRNPALSTGSSDMMHNWAEVTRNTNLPAMHRAIIPSFEVYGLAAIAVSYAGAQRMLHEMSWLGMEKGLDWSVQRMLKDGTVRGWTVAPPIMGTWTVGDSEDSDINMGTKASVTAAGSKSNLEGTASNIVHSARTALGKTLERENYWTKDRFGLA